VAAAVLWQGLRLAYTLFTVPHTRPLRRAREGYTLIELMIVVVIIGILAAVAIPSFQSYLQRSRTAEAVVFLGEIKQRQEAYRAEFGQYCNVPAWNPVTLPMGGDKVVFDGNAAGWAALGAAPDGPVRFQYRTLAGPPGTNPGIAGYDGSDFWWYAQARADLDGDGDNVIFETYSADDHIFVADDSMNQLAQGWE